MVSLGKVYYRAQSRLEAESWINSTGMKRYPQYKFGWVRKGDEWLVVKK